MLSDSVKDHLKSIKSTTVYAKQTPNVNVVKASGQTPVETLFQKIFSRNRTRSSASKSQAQHKPKVKSTECEKSKCDNSKDENSSNVRRKTNYGIMKTNSFTIEITVSKVVISPAQKRKIIKVQENRLALFPIISRLNHSCQPNCNHYWCGQAGKFKIRAIR